MHWLDITLLVVLGLGLILGAWSGFLWQMARLVSFGVALYACIFGHGFVYDVAQPMLPDWAPWLVKVLAYIVTFAGVYFILFGITWVLEQWMKKSKLRTLDRVMGAVLGGIKSILLSGVVLLGMAIFATEQCKEMLAQSYLASPVLTVMHVVIIAVPQEYKDGLATALDKVREVAVKQAEEASKAAANNALPDIFKPSTAKEPQ